MNYFETYDKIKITIEFNYELLKNSNVVLVPFGKHALLVKEILNWQYGIQEKYIIDNGLAKRNSKIASLEEFKKRYMRMSHFSLQRLLQMLIKYYTQN